MKKIILFGLVVSVLGFTPLHAQDCAGVGCLPQEAQNQCTKNFRDGCIDWANGVFYAVGFGVPNTKFKSAAQRNYSAQVAAEQVAMRNLLRLVETTLLDSETTVQDGMLESDRIRTKIKWLKFSLRIQESKRFPHLRKSRLRKLLEVQVRLPEFLQDY